MKCTGECCRSFPVGSLKRVEDIPENVKDGFILRAMLSSDGEGNFTCNAWEPSTKLCTIYENRPDMCRRFPSYGREDEPCTICGATDHEDAVSKVVSSDQTSEGVDSDTSLGAD